MNENMERLQQTWLQDRSDLSRAVVREKVQALDYAVGSLVEVKLYDGRTLQATVKRIDETVAGKKVGIAYESCALTVNATQIVRVLK